MEATTEATTEVIMVDTMVVIMVDTMVITMGSERLVP